jgi:hypothetical protein
MAISITVSVSSVLVAHSFLSPFVSESFCERFNEMDLEMERRMKKRHFVRRTGRKSHHECETGSNDERQGGARS